MRAEISIGLVFLRGYQFIYIAFQQTQDSQYYTENKGSEWEKGQLIFFPFDQDCDEKG